MKTLEQRVKDLEQKALTAIRYTPGGGAAAVARLVVGGGATIGQISKYQFTLGAVSVPANSYSIQTIAVPGLALNDWVLVNPPTLSPVVLCSCLVNAVNSLQIQFVNPSTAASTTPAGTYTVIAIRV